MQVIIQKKINEKLKTNLDLFLKTNYELSINDESSKKMIEELENKIKTLDEKNKILKEENISLSNTLKKTNDKIKLQSEEKVLMKRKKRIFYLNKKTKNMKNYFLLLRTNMKNQNQS